MNQKHVDKKIKVYAKEAEMRLQALRESVQSFKYISESTRSRILNIINHTPWDYKDYIELEMISRFPPLYDLDTFGESLTDGKSIKPEIQKEIDHFTRITTSDIRFLHFFYESDEGRARYDRYLDSKYLHLEGDIIITDPCYILRSESSDDWDRCKYGSNMEVLGIKNYLTHETLYGDWSCTTFNTITKKPIGEFCADAGLVSVFLLDEVLAYNPGFNYHVERPWTTTWIKDFKGDVQIVIKHHKSHGSSIDIYDEKDYDQYECQVIGTGIIRHTGELIKFVGKQTGI